MLGRSLIVALLLLLPAAQAQSLVTPAEVDTTLYFHLLNIQDFPINTQVPDYDWTEEVTYGAGTSTATCVGNAGAGNTLGAEYEYHTYRGYSSPSFVEYDNIENGMPRTHPERGLGANITINATGLMLHWFLVATGNIPNGLPSIDPNPPVPNVIVRATLRAGDAISMDDKAYDSGPILWQGEAGPATLAAGQALGPDGRPAANVQSSIVNGRYVYDFSVPLVVLDPILPRATGFNLRIDVFMDNPACADPMGDGYVMPNLVTVFSNGEHRPRVELRNTPALVIGQPLLASSLGNRTGVALEWNVASVWGSYDVLANDQTLEITGPGEVQNVKRTYVVQRTHEHYHLNEPVRTGWEWSFVDGRPADGTYTATASASNLQHTAIAESTIQFRIKDGQIVAGPDRELPGLGVFPIAVALAALALLVRRT